jgi:hypothetical protein
MHKYSINEDLVPLIIAQNARAIDTTGDYIKSIDDIAQLIHDYGKQEYNRGKDSFRNEDMGH